MFDFRNLLLIFPFLLFMAIVIVLLLVIANLIKHSKII